MLALDILAADGDNTTMFTTTTTKENPMDLITAKATVKIGRTTYTVEGPTPLYGTFGLTGPRGAAYFTTQAYLGDFDTLKLLGMGRSGAIREVGLVSRATLLAAVAR